MPRGVASRESLACLETGAHLGEVEPQFQLVMRHIDNRRPVPAPLEIVGQRLVGQILVGLGFLLGVSGQVFSAIENSNVPRNPEIVVALAALDVRYYGRRISEATLFE